MNCMNKVLFQQGDVLFVSLDLMPREAKGVEHIGILVEGEKTGHNHRIAICDMPNVLFYEKDGQLFIKNEKTITVEHPEHHKIELPSGTWEIKKVKEYDHFLEEIRSVRD